MAITSALTVVHKSNINALACMFTCVELNISHQQVVYVPRGSRWNLTIMGTSTWRTYNRWNLTIMGTSTWKNTQPLEPDHHGHIDLENTQSLEPDHHGHIDLENTQPLEPDHRGHIDLENTKPLEIDDHLESSNGSVDHSEHLKYINIKTMESIMFEQYDKKSLPRNDETTVNVNLMLSLRTIIEFVRSLASIILPNDRTWFTK